MKVIKAGDRNYDKPWVGQEVTCARCKCVFILDETDQPKFTSDQRDGDYYEITCPTCKGVVTFTRSACRPIACQPVHKKMEECPHCKRYGIGRPIVFESPSNNNLICIYCKGVVRVCPDCGGSGCGDYPYPCDTCGGSGKPR